MGTEYVVELTTDTFGETLILSNTGNTLDQARRAAARWSKKNPRQLAYVVRYRNGISTGHICYSAGRICSREGDFLNAVQPEDNREPSRFMNETYVASFAA